MRRRGAIFVLVLMIFLIIVVNYNFLDEKLTGFVSQSESAKVTRVVDGDTLELEDGRHVRLLGVNTPEKGELYYKEAAEFTRSYLENKTISLEFGKEKIDLYNRTLAYVYIGKEIFNIKLVEEGFANFYFPSGKDAKYPDFKKAWEACIKENVNLCEKSKNNCIVAKKIIVENQTVVFENLCFYSVSLKDWKIKDEGRKEFIFPDFEAKQRSTFEVVVGEGQNTDEKIYWERKDYVWTKAGDTLFLRDEEGKLVLWHSY